MSVENIFTDSSLSEHVSRTHFTDSSLYEHNHKISVTSHGLFPVYDLCFNPHADDADSRLCCSLRTRTDIRAAW